MNAQEFMDSLTNRLTLKAKCWDIVVKKHIDLILFRNDFVNTSLTYEDYLGVQGIYGTKQLTEEEFDTLKMGLWE